MARRNEAGQVGVETALVMPLTVFLILGIIQLSMMQQARLLTEYAAFRAARAGSIDQASCAKMNAAALEGILPSFGRTDTAAKTLATYAGNMASGLPVMNLTLDPIVMHIINLAYGVTEPNGAPASPYKSQDSQIGTDFDDPGHPLTLIDLVVYNYELRIPFANWMIHGMWTGAEFMTTQFDALMPVNKPMTNTTDMGQAKTELTNFNDTRSVSAKDPFGNMTTRAGLAAQTSMGSFGPHRYFVPIRASYSMRMMSNLPYDSAASTSGSFVAVKDCSGTRPAL